MFSLKRAKVLIITNAVFYVLMIFANFLANALPINGQITGAISDSYFNLFAPIGSTFSIWGLIYLLTGVYAFPQLANLNNLKSNNTTKSNYKLNLAFLASSILNIIWIVLWHYELMVLSTLAIIGMLISLGYISVINRKNQNFIKLTFGIYFGWITIATIANITIMLVSLGLPNNTVGATIQTSIIILVASIIGSVTTYTQKDIGYAGVILWALLGIYLKHTSPFFFDYGYQAVIDSVIIASIVVAATVVFTINKIINEKKVVA